MFFWQESIPRISIYFKMEEIEMAEIKINIIEINNSIVKLQALKSKCISNRKNSPITVGGGQTVNELEMIAGQYRAIDSNLETLMANTIAFLTNLKESYITSDQKAAQGMNQSGE